MGWPEMFPLEDVHIFHIAGQTQLLQHDLEPPAGERRGEQYHPVHLRNLKETLLEIKLHQRRITSNSDQNQSDMPMTSDLIGGTDQTDSADFVTITRQSKDDFESYHLIRLGTLLQMVKFHLFRSKTCQEQRKGF